MNFATFLVLLLVAVAVYFALRAMRRERTAPAVAGRSLMAGSTARPGFSAVSGSTGNTVLTGETSLSAQSDCSGCAGCSLRTLCRK